MYFIALLGFSHSYQVNSQDSTLTWLASVTDFPTATASPVHASSVGDKTSGMVVAHLLLSAKLSTALRGLPTFCLSSSDRTNCDFRFPIVITFDFQSGPEFVPRDEVSHQLTGMGGGFWLAQPTPVPSVWQSSATKASNPPSHGIAALIPQKEPAGWTWCMRLPGMGAGVWPVGKPPGWEAVESVTQLPGQDSMSAPPGPPAVTTATLNWLACCPLQM